MVAIKSFTFDPLLGDSFIRLGYALYRGDPNWIPPCENEMRAQLAPEFDFYRKPQNSHRHFLASSGGAEIGRISAFVNSDLKDRDGAPVGAVGFFECTEDYAAAEALLDAAVRWLRDERAVRRIWGPMNFDIWHGYRLMTRGFGENLFVGEPYNKPFYPAFFERYGFLPLRRWHSVEITGRETLESIIAPAQPCFERLLGRGYRFEPFEPKQFNETLRKLHFVLNASFREFVGFTPIPFADFEQRFKANRHAVHSRLLTLVYNSDEVPVGFAGAFYDVAHAARAANGRTDLIARIKFLANRRVSDRVVFYLCGSIPNETTKPADFGRAAFYYTIRRILDEGYEKVLIALMSRGSAMARLARADISGAQREYALYELKL